MRRRGILGLWVFFVIFALTGLAHAYTPPKLEGAVVDPSHVLAPAQKTAIASRIATYRTRTTNEIVVFLLPSLGGETIEDVAYGAFNTWKIGKAGKDNGVLLTIAFAEHKIRIETGKGIGDRLTDLESSHINRDRIAPLLREGRNADAITAGLDAIEAALDGRPAPTAGASAEAPPAAPAPASTFRSDWDLYWEVMPGTNVAPAFIEAQNKATEKSAGKNKLVVVVAEDFSKFDEATRRARTILAARNRLDGYPILLVIGRVDGRVFLESKGWPREHLEATYAAMLKAIASVPVDDATLRAIGEIALDAEEQSWKARLPRENAGGGSVLDSPVFAIAVVVGLLLLLFFYLAARRGITLFRPGQPGTGEASDTSSTSTSSFSSSDTSTTSTTSSSSSDTYTGGGGSSGGGGSTDSW